MFPFPNWSTNHPSFVVHSAVANIFSLEVSLIVSILLQKLLHEPLGASQDFLIVA